MRTPRCTCHQAWTRCPACHAWASAQDVRRPRHTYQGRPIRTWATPHDIQRAGALRRQGHPWTSIRACLGLSAGALRAIRRLGLLEDVKP
jgi:hypothetical protein